MTETEVTVIKIASEELGLDENELNLDTSVSIFADSLEYLNFTIRLQDLGRLSEEDISAAETLGDLANAIIVSNGVI